MTTYLSTTCLAFLLSLGFTPAVIAAAHRFGIIDRPNARSSHSRPVARAGGIAIFAAFVPVVLAVLMLNNTIGASLRLIQPKIIVLLAGSAVMFATGLIDDLFNVRARYKLIIQIIAAIAACAAGIRIESISVADVFTINFGIYSWPLTILWIIGVTNAVNLIDGLDGLAAGISAIACGTIAVLAVTFENPVIAVMALALLGSLTGFLLFNFNPARIFMGDCGSLFLGYILAVSSVLCSVKTHTLAALALPVLALGIPIFDTLFSMLRRFLERRSMFAPDRGHFHHRLIDLGLSHRHAVIAAYAVTIILAGMGCFMIAARSWQVLAIFISLLVMLLLVFRMVGSVQLRGTIAGIRSKSLLARQMRSEIRDFEDVQLHFRNARSLEDWWQSVELAAEKMDFVAITLDLPGREGTTRKLKWQSQPRECGLLTADDVVAMKAPIPDRRQGPPLKMEVELVADSLESVGRRATLFARLLEENGLHTLPRKDTGNKWQVTSNK